MTDKFPQGLVSIHVHVHQHEGTVRGARLAVPPAYSPCEIDVGWYIVHDIDKGLDVGGVVVIAGENQGTMVEHWYLTSKYEQPTPSKVVSLKFTYKEEIPDPFDGFAHWDKNYADARYIIATCEQQQRPTPSSLPARDAGPAESKHSEDDRR